MGKIKINFNINYKNQIIYKKILQKKKSTLKKFWIINKIISF
jgi:hypothetical protein